ncbi:hypothetical protein BJ878DRAFT_552368 [Calycina marina]|uniref:Uncharacterized protein n=1 Tax=Calycina marina TaxID=1763456 RepID=A0A9P7Z9T5_9HELO|nr:hypothetical protein BJ878DRAFT_552368 [Calycina marina]
MAGGTHSYGKRNRKIPSLNGSRGIGSMFGRLLSGNKSTSALHSDDTLASDSDESLDETSTAIFAGRRSTRIPAPYQSHRFSATMSNLPSVGVGGGLNPLGNVPGRSSSSTSPLNNISSSNPNMEQGRQISGPTESTTAPFSNPGYDMSGASFAADQGPEVSTESPFGETSNRLRKIRRQPAGSARTLVIGSPVLNYTSSEQANALMSSPATSNSADPRPIMPKQYPPTGHRFRDDTNKLKAMQEYGEDVAAWEARNPGSKYSQSRQPEARQPETRQPAKFQNNKITGHWKSSWKSTKSMLRGLRPGNTSITEEANVPEASVMGSTGSMQDSVMDTTQSRQDSVMDTTDEISPLDRAILSGLNVTDAQAASSSSRKVSNVTGDLRVPRKPLLPENAQALRERISFGNLRAVDDAQSVISTRPGSSRSSVSANRFDSSREVGCPQMPERAVGLRDEFPGMVPSPKLSQMTDMPSSSPLGESTPRRRLKPALDQAAGRTGMTPADAASRSVFDAQGSSQEVTSQTGSSTSPLLPDSGRIASPKRARVEVSSRYEENLVTTRKRTRITADPTPLELHCLENALHDFSSKALMPESRLPARDKRSSAIVAVLGQKSANTMFSGSSSRNGASLAVATASVTRLSDPDSSMAELDELQLGSTPLFR